MLVREEQYFKSLFETYPSEKLVLFLSEIEGKPIAAVLAIHLGPTVWGLYTIFDWNFR